MKVAPVTRGLGTMILTSLSHLSLGYVTSPLHQSHSIPQHYSCGKGAFSPRFPVAGDKDIPCLKVK